MPLSYTRCWKDCELANGSEYGSSPYPHRHSIGICIWISIGNLIAHIHHHIPHTLHIPRHIPAYYRELAGTLPSHHHDPPVLDLDHDHVHDLWLAVGFIFNSLEHSLPDALDLKTDTE